MTLWTSGLSYASNMQTYNIDVKLVIVLHENLVPLCIANLTDAYNVRHWTKLLTKFMLVRKMELRKSPYD